MNQIDFEGAKIFEWKTGASTYLVDVKKGARLMKWSLNLAGESRNVIYWPSATPQDVSFGEVRGGNPILFPFAGTNFYGGQKEMWKSPDGVLRKLQKHGYARDGEFELLNIDSTGFSARLIQTQDFKNAYPYDCEFLVSYKFSELSMICDMTLNNKDSVKIPWGAGHHFYFNLPWKDGTVRKDYVLNLESKKQFKISPTMELIPADIISNPDFAESEIINRIHCKLKSNKISFGLKNGEENIFIRIGTSPKPSEWTSVVTWTEKDDSKFFCVEPWIAPAGSAANLKQVSWVEAGQSQTFSVEVGLI